MQTHSNHLSRLARIESILNQAADADADCAAAVQSVVQDLLDYHRAALSQMIELNRNADNCDLLRRWADDELVASLLLLYDLHPDDLTTRVERALEQVRPYLKSHGGDVALVEIDDGVVRLQMKGSCHGCPSSAMTLKTKIDEAICAIAPDAVAIEVTDLTDEPASAAGFVPVEALFGLHGLSTT